MIALLASAAMGIDVGFTVFGSRTAQAMADTAALDLARYVDLADAQGTNSAVQAYLDSELAKVANDNGSNAHMTVTPGLWLNGAWSIPTGGCAQSVNACNAVSITASQAVPQLFWGGFNSPSRSAIAAVTPTGCFTIGSFLANVNTQQSEVLNDILGVLGGGQANVTAGGYDGLATTYVSINQLIAASGGLLSASNVMTTSLTASQWLTIWTAAVTGQTSAGSCGTGGSAAQSAAAAALNGLNFSGSSSVTLCQLVSVDTVAGVSNCSNSLSATSLQSGLDLLQMLTTEAEIANGTNAIDVTSALSLPGVTSSVLILDLISPPAVGNGPVGTTAQTAQVKADLQLTVPIYGVLDIPLTALSGTATLRTVNCTNDAMTSTNIDATTSPATAAVTLGGSNIATLSIAGYSGQTQFLDSVVPPTDATTAAGTNPVMIGTQDPSLNYTGLSPLSPVFTLLTSTLPPVLGPTLQAAGVTAGGADLAMLGADCGVISLVR